MVKVHRIKSASDAKKFEEDVMMCKKPFVLIATASWCGHCQMFKPEWEKAKRDLQKEKSSADITEIDDTVRSSIIRESPSGPFSQLINQIVGYPTIVVMKSRGKSVAFESGERTKENLVDFVSKHIKPAQNATTPSRGQTSPRVADRPQKSTRPASSRDKGTRRHQ